MRLKADKGVSQLQITVKVLIRLKDAQTDLSLRMVHMHFVGFVVMAYFVR